METERSEPRSSCRRGLGRRDGRLDIIDSNYMGDSLSVVLGQAPPRLLSIDRAGVGPVTSMRNVSFDVKFSEPVSGVDASDFTLTGGLTTSGYVVTGGPTDYNVAVSGVVGTGQLQLNLLNDGTI